MFKNGATRNKLKKSKPKQCTSLLDDSLTSQLWYKTYQKTWHNIKSQSDSIQSDSHGQVIKDLLNFVGDAQNNLTHQNVIPTAALLTGINQTDHMSRFENLAEKIRKETYSNVALLQSRNCPSMKAAIETIVASFVEDSNDDTEQRILRKNQMNLHVLEAWYDEKYEHLDKRPNLAIIIPDFEVFNAEVLQDLIIILHNYSEILPFVLIFGVATSLATIHSVLPYHVTSKISLKAFQSEPSSDNLNKILDQILLSPYSGFHLSGKSFKLLVDIFLFYDFSVQGFVEGYRYCLMEHYFQGNAFALCDNFEKDEDLEAVITKLDKKDIEDIRQLPSFRPFIESLKDPQRVIDLLTKDRAMKDELFHFVKDIQNYWFNFHCGLRILHALVQDLPKNQLGRQLRELYSTCISGEVTKLPEFVECFQFLNFLSQEEVIEKLTKIMKISIDYIKIVENNGCFNDEALMQVIYKLQEYLDRILTANLVTPIAEKSPPTEIIGSPKMGRQELKEKLLNAAKQSQPESQLKKSVRELFKFVENKIIKEFLRPANKGPPLLELFMFSDVTTVRQHIVGVPRASIHTALNNPNYYLQCNCCPLEKGAIVPTMPDISVAYKLHLECGRMINLFDWLQAFRMIVDENDLDQEHPVSQEIQ